MSPGVPSYWSGVASGSIPFEDLADYSRWACMLLERGNNGPAICTLAGMEDESNLFVLREWHRKALADLGVEPPEGEAAIAVHARGQMEEFLEGRFSCIRLLQTLRDLYVDFTSPFLKPFDVLYCAWWDDNRVSTMDEISARVKRECESFIAKHQAEQGVAPNA